MRRGRALEQALHAQGLQGAAGPMPAQRPPRVFRVVTASTFTAGSASDEQQTAGKPETPAAAPIRRRMRRLEAGKRPGPVKLVVPAPEVSEPPAVAAPVQGLSHLEEMATLRALMASLDDSLQEALQARACHFLA